MEIIVILQVLMVISIVSLSVYTIISSAYFYIENKISLFNLAIIAILIIMFIMVNAMTMVKLNELKRLLE
jgi:hypothetical protein